MTLPMLPLFEEEEHEPRPLAARPNGAGMRVAVGAEIWARDMARLVLGEPAGFYGTVDRTDDHYAVDDDLID